MDVGTLGNGVHFTQGLWASYWNLTKIAFAVTIILLIQSGHKPAHNTAPVQ